jgi:hypothetical protein
MLLNTSMLLPTDVQVPRFKPLLLILVLSHGFSPMPPKAKVRDIYPRAKIADVSMAATWKTLPEIL